MTLNDYIRDNHESVLSGLKKQYAAGNLALLLGSGVSMKYCPLSWQGLVLELFKQKFYDEYPYRFDAIYNETMDFPPQAPDISLGTNKINNVSMIQSSLLDIAEYASTTRMRNRNEREEFELNKTLVVNRVEKVLRQYKRENLEQGNTALQALVSLSFDKCSGESKIDTIITYNYDDFAEALLLRQTQEYIDTQANNLGELELKAILPQKVLNVATVYEENSLRPHYYRDISDSGMAISVYHVHGFVPVALLNDYCKKNTLRTPERSSNIVLGDRSYNSLKGNDWLWANSIQAQVFQQKTVFCVGFSCSDPNFRRLAKLVLKERESFSGYAVLTVSDYSREIPKMLGYDYEFGNSDEESQIICSYLKIIEHHYYDVYGLRIIWAENHASIPDIIMKVKTD